MATSLVDKTDLNFLLIGKIGRGKSATGNSILNKEEFVCSASTTAATTDVVAAYAETDSFSIKVVDGPGLKNLEFTEKQNIEIAVKNMTKTLFLCNGGVHIFVLVLKFGERFTQEEKETINTLKEIFGPKFLKERGIIVFTHGDLFLAEMKREKSPNKTFMEWCKHQKKDIKDLFEECNYRIVLFNNVTTTEKEKQRQRNELLRVAHEISKERGFYTNEHFQKFAELREKVTKSKLIIFTENVQKKTNLLTFALGSLTESSSDEDIEQVNMQTIDLQKEIKAQGEDKSVKKMMSILDKVQNNLQELKQGKNKKSVIQKLQKQKEELEKIRENNIPWKYIFIGFGIGAGFLTGVGVIAIIVRLGGGPILARLLFSVVIPFINPLSTR